VLSEMTVISWQNPDPALDSVPPLHRTYERAQRCQELLQHRTLTPESVTAAADRGKRQRLIDSSVSPLGKDEVIDAVFGFVGGGEHLYITGVSKRWRDRYLEHCVKNFTCYYRDGKFVTRSRSFLVSENRPQLALTVACVRVTIHYYHNQISS
jgi:hypothetical protein